jgi:rare lipoprotein A
VGSKGAPVSLLVIGLLAVSAGSAVASECGKAAWYDVGGLTASGERTSNGALAAAHRTLPFGTRVKVENLANGRSVIVRINDRGPFVRGRIIDVTRAAAEKLGFIRSGVVRVRATVIDGDANEPQGSCGEAVAAREVPAPPRPRLAPEEHANAPALEDLPSEPANLAVRFSDAFQPGSWIEVELTKALEAVTPRYTAGGGG